VSRFPLTFALAASAAFFSLSVVVLAACILPAAQWPVSMDQTPNASEPGDDRPVRVRKRPRRNAAGESRATSTVRSTHTCFHDPCSQHLQVYKSEDIPVDGFPLKRRRSRTSDVLLDSEN
jgi:hypothetical protein